ncbi:carboxymuconolactone decarboxylase family protein [Antrihabitans cavernicola]|uniref:Carboxymuconolactone decarboxylase family protein n=1 Tax=Antrihabitans cavernicola TaxID=2495913 RepID=A0A5A7S4P3_9NOCA|nr:carboxymuconolactone decarboxylase family protein [Spelaeibacter cavernicola]KAA0021150.1 carboxymuconolactone decarboxylase family protein [Spelaeibacter cavernicola]
MKFLRKVWHYMKAMGQASGHRTDLMGWLARRPWLLLSTGFYEFSLLASNRVDSKLVALANLKTAGMINCEFCLDIGSALAHSDGVTEQQIRDLPRYKTSAAYNDEEKLVIAFAEAMTVTPAVDLDDLRNQLLAHFSRAQVAELAAAIAWENQRARINQALGVRPMGSAEGMVCAIPDRPAEAG